MAEWLKIEDAPLDTTGHVWCPELGERTDLLGTIYAYHDGKRGVSAQTQGFKFTYWHPLPGPPVTA